MTSFGDKTSTSSVWKGDGPLLNSIRIWCSNVFNTKKSQIWLLYILSSSTVLFSTKLYRALAWNTIDAAGIAGQGHPGILSTVFKHIMVLHLLGSIIYLQAADFFGWCWQHLGATLCFSRLRSRLVQHQFAAILIWERSEGLQTAPKFIWAAPGWWQNPKDPEPRLTTGKNNQQDPSW